MIRTIPNPFVQAGAARTDRPLSTPVRAKRDDAQGAESQRPADPRPKVIACPVLAAGRKADKLHVDAKERTGLGEVGRFVHTGTGKPAIAGIAIAATANGPLNTIRNVLTWSVRLFDLRDGPVIKRGPNGQLAGSRIINLETGEIREEELARMKLFAVQVKTQDGTTALGYDKAAVEKFRQANLEERGGGLRKNDRASKLEFPILVEACGGYITHAEVETMYKNKELPSRFKM